MKNLKIVLLGLFSSVTLAACDSNEHIAWTPDGKRMAVVENSLRIADAEGTLSKSLIPGVDSCLWFADSHHALLKLGHREKRWSALLPLLSASERKQTIMVAERLRTRHGSMKSFEAKNPHADEYGEAALVYINTRYGAQAVKNTFHRWQIAEKDSKFEGAHISSLQIFDIAGVGADADIKVTPGRVLLESRKSIGNVLLSPDGKFVAFSRLDNSLHQTNVIAINNAMVKTIAGHDVEPMAWSGDSRSLAVSGAMSKVLPPGLNKSMPVTCLKMITIADANGTYLSSFDKASELYATSSPGGVRAAGLPDGKILLSGQSPAKAKNNTGRETLTILDTAKMTSSPVPLEDSTLADCLLTFVLNQDGKRVALVTSKNAIYVLDLQSGKSVLIEKPSNFGLAFSPNWRTASELCYPRHYSAAEKQSNGNNHDFGVVLATVPTDLSSWSSNGVDLSASWPADQMKFLAAVQPLVKQPLKGKK